MWQGGDILVLDRTSRYAVCTCGNLSHVTRIAVSFAVFGSFCRILRDTDSCQQNSVSIVLLRICVCELNSEHLRPAHIYDLYVFVSIFSSRTEAPNANQKVSKRNQATRFGMYAARRWSESTRVLRIQ